MFEFILLIQKNTNKMICFQNIHNNRISTNRIIVKLKDLLEGFITQI
jgi:hypothetical protein